MRDAGITKSNISESYASLIERAKLDIDFIVLIIGAAVICSFGFKMNSPSIIVGAMVISPLLYPVVSIGTASFKKDWGTLFHGIRTLVIGLIIAIIAAIIVNSFFFTEHRSEIVDRLSSAPIDYFFVALFSGLTGTFAYFWPAIIEAIAGIAISVALIPPIVLIGIGIANFDSQLSIASATIVAINILGIYLGSLFMFIGLHFMARKS